MFQTFGNNGQTGAAAPTKLTKFEIDCATKSLIAGRVASASRSGIPKLRAKWMIRVQAALGKCLGLESEGPIGQDYSPKATIRSLINRYSQLSHSEDRFPAWGRKLFKPDDQLAEFRCL